MHNTAGLDKVSGVAGSKYVMRSTHASWGPSRLDRNPLLLGFCFRLFVSGDKNKLLGVVLPSQFSENRAGDFLVSSQMHASFMKKVYSQASSICKNCFCLSSIQWV